MPDSWVTSTVVYDRVPRREDLMARRIPSGIDVAFSVLANDQTVPWLVDRMSRDDGLMFRDGIEYQTNLAALRMVFDGVRDEGWNGSLYTGWLQALRILSAPTTGAPFPEAMRTHAWAMKTLNTQLASWTQLRHDTVGYVKQSATTPGFCSYPYGFVEPLPDFYGQLEALATGARTAFSALSMSGTADIPPSDAINFAAYVSLPKFKANMVSFLGRFATTMATLRGIASKELTQQPLNEEETQFLRDIVQIDTTYYGNLIFDGWYPGLFYRSNEGMDPRWTWAMGGSESRPVHDADLDDRLVADVHTDTPDDICGDPGSVLHEGIGPVYLLLMAVDNGPDRMICAGPVFSHFEFLTPNAVRLTDAEWKGQLNAGLRPLHPTWTQEYLVPENSPTCGQPAGNGQPSPEPQDCQVSPAAMQSDP
ncbi:MAG: DUF3160 domain-containing protein [Verrucomicrobiales bacterium]|nr:DUF3160 domain-containing protein [Verrucomicrobiales bacterium]